MAEFHVNPDLLSQFGTRGRKFCLVTTADREADFKVLPTTSYDSISVVRLGSDQTLEHGRFKIMT